MGLNRIIVDADPILYTAGAAAEQREHDIIWEDDKGGMHRSMLKEDPRAFVKQIKADGGKIVERELMIHPKPWPFCAMLVRSVVGGIRRRCETYLKTDKVEWELILSGEGNFRNGIATVTPYKGSRKDKLKPHWYPNIRQYLIDSFDAIVVDGIEADDEVSIRMNEARSLGDKAILATIDKDLDQIEGVHWDYKKHVMYNVTHDDGQFLLYSQILSGDATDDIPGCMGLGPVNAQKLIKKWSKEWEDSEWRHDSFPDMDMFLWENIVAEYSQRGCKGAFPNLFPEALAIEQARLVALQEYRTQLWTPPGAELATTEGIDCG